MRRGEVWWGSLGEPDGSGPGFRRPLLVIQSNEFNESAIRTTICAVITSNLRLAAAPGNVHLARKSSGLPNESIVNVSQIVTVDKQRLTKKIGRLSAEVMRNVDVGLRLSMSL